MKNLSRRIARRPRLTLLIVGIVFLGAAAFGTGASDSLKAGGLTDPSAESSRADRLLERAGIAEPDLLLMVESDRELGSPAVRARVSGLEREIEKEGGRIDGSFWQPGGDRFGSEGEGRGFLLASFPGDEAAVAEATDSVAVSTSVVGADRDITVSLGGQAGIGQELTERVSSDLARAEMLALPLILLVLVIAFGSLVAASFPLLIGVISIIGSMAILRVIAGTTDVSIFALNLAIALGLGLAIDYSLLVVRRYREERVRLGGDTAVAVEATMVTAGRTIAFSALTVAVAMLPLLLFPVYFLRSFAYTGAAVVLLAAASTLIVLPAMLVLAGDRIDSLNVRTGIRRLTGRAADSPDTGRLRWATATRAILRRRGFVAVFSVAILVVMALPALGVQLQMPDERTLPPGSGARNVQEAAAETLSGAGNGSIRVVLPRSPNLTEGEVERYSREVSGLPGSSTATVTATPELFTIAVASPPAGSKAAESLLREIRSSDFGPDALVGGRAAQFLDSREAVTGNAPLAIGIALLLSFLLLIGLTRSLILPLQAIFVSGLSLAASLGVLVWALQDGNISWFLGGFEAPGYLALALPPMILCVAFGLSMDYAVFLLSRIREEWDAGQGNDEAVVQAASITGGVITAAALALSIALGAMAVSPLVNLKVIGGGLAFAVLLDATVVRCLLVPSLTSLTGRANWWLPSFRQSVSRPGRRRPQEKGPGARSSGTAAPSSRD